MVVEAALLTSLGWVASPLIKTLFDKAHHNLGTGINEKRKILEATVLPRLSLAIEKAEKSPNKEKVVEWLKRLKGAYYEAEEAIDIFEYEKLKQKVKDERGTRISFPSQFVPQKIKDRLSVFTPQKIMLKRCIDNLIKIADEANDFSDLLGGPENANGSDAERETYSNLPVRVFGREIDKEKIVSLLTQKPSNSEPGPSTRPAFPIIAITGRSGAGKTTLAQYVYEHMDQQQHFNLRVWVYVPRKFKATDVIKNMIEIIKAKEGASNNYPFTSLEALSTELRCMLGSKKLLLVLDDFWSDTEDFDDQWDKFIGSLSSCSPETRILLTTQSNNVSQLAMKVEVHVLKDLEEGQFSELFMHHAWPSNSHLQKEEFEKVGKKIAVKLKGDPGAAKLVGRQLREKLDLRHWEEVTEKDWLEDGMTMKPRIWSYQQLSLNLQRCFAICSLFPKGSHTPGKTLIDIWMAEGFIKPTDNEERLEKIGEDYLQVLISRFFLEQIAGEEGWYQLHDLLHKLAERVQGDDLIRIDYSGEIPSHENIGHMRLPSTMINQLPKKIPSLKNIRTFCIYNDGDFVEMEVIEEILKRMQKLRVLILLECCGEFPKSIGNLKHLRCLYFFNFSGPFKKLPNSICKLYHLKSLFLPNCESVPEIFSELISLRSLVTAAETLAHISHVGRLRSLQSLGVFVVRKKRGYELHQLENLNQLKGELCIIGLENVVSIVDAVKAKMRDKKYLEEVKFIWTGLSTQYVQLLDALQPHPNISALTLYGFGGDGLPNWLLSQNSLNHLTSLTLVNCDKVQEISSIDKSLPNCRSLVLRGLKNLKEMPSLPPNLTSLEVDHLPQLSYFSNDDLLMKEERKQSKLEGVKQIAECWREYIKFESILRPDLLFVKERFEVVLESYNSSSQYRNSFSEIVNFDPDNDDYSQGQLFVLWLMCMHCYIETMFNKNEESNLILLSSLTHLQISSCSITSDALSTSIQCLVSLSKLELSFIQTITSLPPKEILCSLKSLKSLTIKKCFLLSSLGGIGAVISLKVLELNFCFNLNPSNEPLPSSLETLVLFSCSNPSNVTCALDVGRLSHLELLSINGWVGRLEGLNSLNGLCTLLVLDCPGINPSSPMDKYTFELHEAGIDNLLQLKLILSNESISSIEILSIFDYKGDSSDDEVFQSLTSLMQLRFYSCNATHLPKNLKNLSSLSYMLLDNCPNLCELEFEDLPRNLQQMKIKDCPTLIEKVNRNGPYQVQSLEGCTTLTFPIASYF